MNEYYFIGLDETLVDLIYFQAESEKLVYLQRVKDALDSLDVSIGAPRLSVIDKVTESDLEIPLFLDILAYSGDLQYSKNTSRNNFYTNCKLCEFNLIQKIESGTYNFDTEELLLNQIIPCELNGYAKLNLVFRFGEVFSLIGINRKRDLYFNLLRDLSYDLSPATITGFYKLIAEIYLSSNDPQTALSWYKNGLEINPKFAVKNIIKKLESDLS